LNTRNPFVPYLLPFGVFALLTYAGPLLDVPKLYTYPIKTVAVAGMLAFYFNHYREELRPCFSLSALIAGILVFLLWVLSEGLYPQFSQPSVFDPFEEISGPTVYLFIGFRLAGAVLVVPVMEELFWRSFALRYLINPKFKFIPLGQFSWFSFIVVSIAFGFEHYRWLPGIAAGMVYAGLLYREKNLFAPILAHAVTNLLLGIYVLATEQWAFW